MGNGGTAAGLACRSNSARQLMQTARFFHWKRRALFVRPQFWQTRSFMIAPD
jgi:hypothetical protein